MKRKGEKKEQEKGFLKKHLIPYSLRQIFRLYAKIQKKN